MSLRPLGKPPVGYPPEDEDDLAWNNWDECRGCGKKIRWAHAYGGLTQPTIEFMCRECHDDRRPKLTCNICHRNDKESDFKPIRIISSIGFPDIVLCNQCVVTGRASLKKQS